MAPFAVPFIGGFFKGGLLAKSFNALFFGDLLNSLLGNPIGGFIDRLTGRQDITDDGKDNLGINKKLLDTGRGGGSRSATQAGALRFMGGADRFSDDAPDVISTNESVLNNIAKNQGLSLGTTIAPQLDAKKVMVEGFTGLVGIIDQINKNIGAIGNSLIETSAIEGSYRKKLMEDLQEEIAEKGKTRARTRFEQSVFNFVTTKRKNIQKITGNLKQDLSNALLTSIGLEIFGNEDAEDAANELSDLIKEGGDKFVEEYGDLPRIDFEGGLLPDIPFYQEGKSEAAKNLEDAGGTLGSFTGIGGPSPIEAFLNLFKFDKEEVRRQNIFGMMSKEPLVEGAFDTSPSFDFSNTNVVPNVFPSTPLSSLSGTTQVIDLRTAQNIAGGDDNTDSNNVTSELDSQIISLDPSRRVSPYEGFTRSV